MMDDFEGWERRMVKERAEARKAMVEVADQLLDRGFAPVCISLACDDARSHAVQDVVASLPMGDHFFMDIHGVSFHLGNVPREAIVGWLHETPMEFGDLPFPKPVIGADVSSWLWSQEAIHRWTDAYGRRSSGA